jgi:hypothetical protein
MPEIKVYLPTNYAVCFLFAGEAMDSTKASANQNTQSLGHRASEMADSAKHQAQVGDLAWMICHQFAPY